MHRLMHGAGIALLLIAAPGARAERATVALASSLKPAIAPLVASFEAATGHQLALVPGATGKLAAQIVNGAPFDVLMAADVETMQQLVTAGQVQPGTWAVFADGRLALWSMRAGMLAADGVSTLRAARFRTLAIAQPRTAPYGRAALETLTALGLWAALEPKLVRGESAAQTLQFVESGAADLGFVPLAMLREGPASNKGRAWVVPDSLHAPIRHTIALLKHGEGNTAARAWVEFLGSAAARARFTALGYRVP